MRHRLHTLTRGIRTCSHLRDAVGNNASLAAACAASLQQDSAAGWHDAYNVYYRSARTRDAAVKLFRVDAHAFDYSGKPSMPNPLNVVFHSAPRARM